MKKTKAFRALSVVLALLLIAALFAGCAAPSAPASPTAKPAETKQEAPKPPAATPAASKPAASKTDLGAPVTLKAVTAWPKDTMENQALWMLQKMVEERSQGNIKINWIGGPEAIPTMEQWEALRKGVVDMILTAGAYGTALAPEALAQKLTQLAPWEERTSGSFDIFSKAYSDKVNAVFVGRGLHGKKFRLYTNVEVKSSADFKGLRIRVTPIYKAFVEALGGAPVSIDPGEVYTALERKVVDGYGWPEARISDYGWHEVTKYAVNPTFFVVDVLILANKDAWNKLTEAQRNLIVESMKQVEKDSAEWVKGEIDKEQKFIQEKGVKIITVSDPDKYLDLAYKAAWDEVLKAAPQNGPKLKETLSKK